MALFSLVRPLAFAIDPERAHGLTITALKALPTRTPPPSFARLATRVAGLDFANPVGLAAGFDKDAEVFGPMLGLGFGFVEVGTLTPEPQAGNAKPRVFRLVDDRGVINRLGFNNGGQRAALARLRDRSAGIVGVNLGANKDTVDRIADYAAGVRAMAGVADYLTINISSPNTPGLRALQDEGALDALLGAVMDARGEATSGTRSPPVFLKVAPDLSPSEIDGVVTVAMAHWIDGIIVGNTTVSRPVLTSMGRDESGGLSGAPLGLLALQRLKDFRAASGGAVPLIAAGGIASGADALARILAGASLVQLYTALIYGGPRLVRRIVRDLDALLARDGFASVDDAVGKAG